MGTRFPVHGVANHVFLKQKGPSLAKFKLALSIGAFYNPTLAWLPRVTKRTGLGMRLNPQMFLRGPKEGESHLVRKANPRGV
jgi:hypothetical protein